MTLKLIGQLVAKRLKAIFYDIGKYKNTSYTTAKIAH